MSSTNIRSTLACPKCKAAISIFSRPILDPVGSPEQYQAFLADSLNPKSCPGCGLSLSIPTPTVVNGRHWVGVVLENPYPVPAAEAFTIVATLTQDLDVLAATPSKPILVVGRSDELRRILANRAGDRFCAISIAKVAIRNHGVFVEMLRAIADAYLEADQPEAAYWDLSEAVGLFAELYFLPDFFHLLEMTALAAGGRIAQGLRVPQTAQQHFDFMRSQLEPHRQPVPAWCFSTYLCFYEKGPHPPWMNQVPHLWSTVVDLLVLESDGSIDLRKAERHQVAVPVQAVGQQELTVAEQARQYMLFLMMASDATRRLPALPSDVQSASRFSRAELGLKWGEMGEGEQAELAQVYHRLTGLDFRTEFRVDEEKESVKER